MGSLSKKKQLVEQLNQNVKGATATYVVDYRGLSVGELTEIRRELRKSDTTMTVAKNTLLKRVVADIEMAPVSEFLSGPTALVVSKGDQVAPVKVISNFFKKNKKKNVIRGGFMEGNALSQQDVEAIAKLPSLDELRAKLVGGIASPLTGLIMAVSGPQRTLVNVLDQFAKKKQEEES